MLIWAAFAGYFAFTDLQISISVVNQNSGWAIFLENFGEIPGLLVLYLSTQITLAYYSSLARLRQIAYSIILIILTYRPRGFFGMEHSTKLRL